MANVSAETLTELERQAESRRAELAQTVDELHNRVSPEAIKADVRNYARGRMHVLEERIRENPLQAMAIAAGIAYPLWRVMGRIPAPLLLIGAGLVLTRRSHGTGDGESHGHAGEFGGRSVADQVKDAASTAAEKVSGTLADVRDMASEKMADLAGTVTGGYQAGREAAADAAGQIEDTYHRTGERVLDLLDRHPIIGGAVAFAAGSLLASALPVSSQENRLLGDASDDIKRRGQDLATEGLEEAKAAARQIYEETSAQVREQGLTPAVAENAVRNTVETARAAVERTTGAAAGMEPMPASSRRPRSP